ncbi:MAG TPA: hypothetical protein VH088_05825 [Terriglobales bacterium]|jgi:hypothetical protein|nr:hypothetical protein [Terriglobales bacterium]
MKSFLRAVMVLACTLSCFGASSEITPTLSFTFDFPGSEPSHYVISIAGDGKASYDSNGKLMAESEPDSNFRLEFVASQETRTRMFELVKKAKYLQGQIDSKKQGLASTGVKTLVYTDGNTNTRATYNYSPVNAVQQLTDLFQSMSSTLEYGRRLEYFHRYQKLALDEELKRMDGQSMHGQLVELSAIAPVLRGIVDDPSVIKVVRSRAQRLLAAGAGQ